MPDALSFFADLSIVIVVAALVGLVFSRFRLPLTVGYILAGVLVGPYFGPALINNATNIRMLSDLGVMFLMFSIGLGFSFRSVRKLGGAVVFPAFWDVAFMVLGGYLLGKMLGWGNLECFLLGLILCDSSTSIAAKTLETMGWIKHRFAECTFAIALIEDVLAILLIAVLNGVAGGSAMEGDIWDTALVVGKQLGVLVLFLVGVVVFGILLVPRLMNYVSEYFDDEIVLLVALGICFGISCWAQNGLGLSLVVGAFLAGTLIAESRTPRRIERTVKPVTNLFGSVFFVSVGLMMQPMVLWQNIGTILIISLAMIVFKLLNNTVACVMVGERPKDAFRVGIAMGQVAEFAFIIAALAVDNQMTTLPLFQIAVGVALVGTATNPYLLRYSEPIYNKVSSLFGERMHKGLRWYRQWIGSLNTQQQGEVSPRVQIRMSAIFMAIDLVICAVLFMVVHFVAQLPVVREFLIRLDGWQIFGLEWNIPWRGILCTGAALLLSLPCFWAAWHYGDKVIRIVTEGSLPRSSRGLLRVRQFIRTLLHVIFGVLLFLYASVLSSSFLRDIWVLGVLALLMLAVAMRFSKRIRKGYSESHAVLKQAFDVDALPPEDIPTLNTIINIHTETITLPMNARVAGKTLGELVLRSETGASVISVASRINGMSITPGGDTLLHGGDTVTVIGSDEQLAKAMAFLARTK